MSINNAFISGNIVRDATLKENGENAICNFTVAVNDFRPNADDYTNYIDCALFGKRAKGLQPYLKKGVKVSVSGKLHYSSWEQDGAKRSHVGINANEIEIMTAAEKKEKPAADDDIPW